MVADSVAHSSLSPSSLAGDDVQSVSGPSMIGGRRRRSGKGCKSARKSGKVVKVVGGKRKSRKTGRKVRKARKSRMTMRMY